MSATRNTVGQAAKRRGIRYGDGERRTDNVDAAAKTDTWMTTLRDSWDRRAADDVYRVELS